MIDVAASELTMILSQGVSIASDEGPEKGVTSKS